MLIHQTGIFVEIKSHFVSSSANFTSWAVKNDPFVTFDIISEIAKSIRSILYQLN